MATLLLSAAAQALSAGAAAWISTLATAAATVAGSYIDSYLFGKSVHQEGPRLESLQVQASTEGAALPEMAGRVRLSGQIIWASKLKEVAKTQSSSGGKGGGGGGASITTYTYYANFAVALCEGVIDRVGQVWADGKPLDMKNVTMRVYKGTTFQNADPLIQGIEGAANVPAYRGTAYVVFDNLELTSFGNRIPQLSFEIFRRVSLSGGVALEDAVKAVTLIPGAGEFAYDTTVETRDLGGGATLPENKHTPEDAADWNVALDDLEASLPNAGTVLLVVGWFGDDLRCGQCTVRPKVETATKTTTPSTWKVHTLDRSTALVVSSSGGTSAYGGTPSDQSIVRAVRDLKARGFSVVFYPFLFMDIAAGNVLPNPYGGTGQPAYPWRGRITCHPASGQPATVDKTSAASTQVASFFGAAAASDMTISVNGSTNAVTVSYSGPAEWSFRRFILHCAKLCAAINAVDAGAVNAFLIGSELRGITTVRDSAANFPAVAKLKTLAADVKSILGGSVKVGYSADWSEYNNYAPADGSGDLFFHLDPLWSDASIDFVGVDLYVPLSDWRDGTSHLDAANYSTIYDTGYLKANIEGGEDFDWYYANSGARDAQVRTAITDGAYGKPWVFRAKDFRNWWLNQHYDRPGGIQSGSPTAWTAQGKPIWFTEMGVPSIDKGTNEPNVFYDPKSSESAVPYYSKGTRDDLIQRRGIEAVLSYWGGANNPVSTVYADKMVGLIAVWTWDARPYPAWPALTDVWGDTALWPYGHWLNGKVGLADLAALVAERCLRVGFTAYDVTGIAGVVVGYVRDRPMSPRAEIELLMNAFSFDAVESEGVVRFVPHGRQAVASFQPSDCVMSGPGDLIKLTRAQETDLPEAISITFIDASNAYQPGTIAASRIAGYSARKTDITVPLVMDQIQARSIAERLLAEAWIGREAGAFALPPDEIALDAGDIVNLVIDGVARAFRLTRISDAWARSMEAQRCESAIYVPALPGDGASGYTSTAVYGPALLELMDLPLLHDADVGFDPYVAASASPFAGVTLLDSATGTSFAIDTDLPIRAGMGETLAAFPSGPTAYFDTTNTLQVKLYLGTLASASQADVLAGRINALAIENPNGDWEIVQFCTATLISAGVYNLTTLLRGRLGTEHAMRTPLAIGARVVVLDGAIVQIAGALAERNVARFYKWGPSPVSQSDPAWQQETFTARCVGLMPWAPVHVAGSRNASGDLAFTWIRRTRFGGVWTDGTDVPLNEESEKYEVDIIKGGVLVVRTIAVASPSATYTAAQQTTDFGSVQSSVAVKVYQISGTVGRGRAASATL